MWNLVCFNDLSPIDLDSVDEMPSTMSFGCIEDLCAELMEWLPGEKIWVYQSNRFTYRLITVFDNGTYEIHKNAKHYPGKWKKAVDKPENTVKEYNFQLQYNNVTGYAFGVNEGFIDIPTDNRMLCEAITLRERARKAGKTGHYDYLNYVVGFLASYVVHEN